MKIRLLFLAVLIFSTASCKKDDINVSGKEVLSSITITDPVSQLIATSKYVYNNQGELTEIISTNNRNLNSISRQVLTYNTSGQLLSCLVTDNTDGDFYKCDFLYDANERIIRANYTPLRANLFVNNVVYMYDPKGRLSSDTLYSPTGGLHSYNVFTYDNNDNVVSYQQFVNTGTDIYTQGKFTYNYDNKKSPFTKLGLLLFTAFTGGGDSYFYLSKNNTTTAYLNGKAITPGGHFVYEYYNNSLLHTSKVNVDNSQVIEFFYQ